MKIALSLLVSLFITVSCNTDKSSDLATEIQTIENGLLGAIQVEGEPVKQYNIHDRMEHFKVPGVSIAVVEDGKVKWAKGYGIANTNTGNTVDINTLFQAGSISKPIAALSALKLVQEGVLNLDDDVNLYLKSWKIPDSKFLKEDKVTLRLLLTHSAGMTVHGFPGYSQTDTFPTINQVLDGDGNTSKIYVDTIPGSIWRYAGGGYTVMEKLVEDMSGLSLDAYMATNILKSIGMTNSTYEQPLGERYHTNVSAAYDAEGKIIDGLWHNYPEQAAAGLWTTPTDLAKYCIEIQQILKGKENSVLSKETVEQMLTKHKNNWGLGPSLQWDADSLVFRHGGKNAGFTNSLISFANRGKAVIVMTNADNGGKLIGEILKSISNYYNWNISNPRIVETISLPEEQLTKLIGKYKLDFQVPDIGNYFIEVKVDGGKLIVNDSNSKETTILTALKENKFIDLDSGQEIKFQLENDTTGLLWNNQYQFYKLDE